jgi:AcrR family transcriptional regulator
VSLAAVEPLTSHRERKKLATRQAIHEAAFELVEEYGLSRTTVEAISERAGVAPRTFWSYFSSKEDAVLDRDPERELALRTALLDRPASEDPLTALRAVLEEQYFAPRSVDQQKAVRRRKLLRREPQLMAAAAATFDDAERSLVAAVAERLGRDPEADLLPGVIVMAACGACRVAHQRWADDNGKQPLPELIDEAFRQLALGLEPLKRPARRGRRR